ncbi:EAL domain-containing protein [Tumebacillus sp. DT12]|uniref:EAL domain-containing protein n=1 Tax=Tumebacillus lacus TaxID=2995335 RepID=A0ABT3X4X9_9BACL|nr:EAL domain-containing protein [Tumebacillus lacus]MCX7570640.1 EAL domain-containing protein [Tumebacillus lacus]
MGVLSGYYHPALVVMSVLVAIIASFTALHLTRRVNASRGLARKIWLFCGAASMGLGIWSMHFVAMLALQLPIPVRYNPVTVFVSVMPAVIAAWIAFFLVSRPYVTARHLVCGSLAMGTGIVSMHYSGMASMQMQAHISYDPLQFGFSVIIAVVASFVAMCLMFSFRQEPTGWRYYVRKVIASTVMGSAIAGMHYIGMKSASFHHQADAPLIDGMVLSSDRLAYLIAIATLLTLALVMVGALIDRRLTDQSTQLAFSELRYRSLFEHNPEAVITLDLEGRFTEANPAAETMLGHRVEDLRDMRVLPFLEREGIETARQLYEQVMNGQAAHFELQLRSANDRLLDVSATGVPMYVDDVITGLYVIAQDITERKRTEAAINHMAYHDDLSGLPNRRLFVARLAEQIEAASKTEGQLAILYLDVDRFKTYNDSLGHPFGDDLLQEVAARLTRCAAAEMTVARLGGDEFTLLLPQVDGPEAPMRLAERVCASVSEPLLIQGYEVQVSASVGIALYPQDGSDVLTLMRNADTAMYRAKSRGNTWQFYDAATMDSKPYERMMLETELRKALERSEFLVYYQPQLNARTGQIEGVEALVRWMHPERGLVSPFHFIPLAEETGLIEPLGDWVLRTACQQMRQWQVAGLPVERVAVNLSLRQFQHQDLVASVTRALAEAELAPSALELEITESMTMDVRYTKQVLGELKALGVQIGIDDFGTGYSSLSYLKSFPIDRLKIDQSFVRDILCDENDAAIVSTIISMAHHLKLKVIAEGVETAEHLQVLTEQGCDEAQGYLFSPPVPAAELEVMLRTQQTAIQSI